MIMSRIYAVVVMCICVLSADVLSAREVIVTGKVFDHLTREALVGARVCLVNPADSAVITDGFASRVSINDNDTVYSSEFDLSIPDNSRDYALCISDIDHQDYHISLPKSSLQTPLLNLGNIYLRKNVRNLSEVTVTASKVKFYNKGDTIVYNADAFNLAEGSMLDALIRQLPGVQLHSDGRIYINGRFVDNLVLNGKDFFKGDNSIMLENIGAYTVKNVKVYERLNAIDSFIGEAVTGDKELVMDVRLKKDYMDSWLGNFKAGGGTSGRYAGQGYAARLTPRSRVSMFANLNNVNESRKPGEGVMEWSPSKMGTGTRKTLSGGIDYFYDLPDNIWKTKGNLVVKRVDNTDETSAAHTNFTFPSYTYLYSHNAIRQRNLEISTNHEIRMERETLLWWITPSFGYKKWNAHAGNTEATFDSEQSDWSAAFIKDIYENRMQDSGLVNRKLSETGTAGHNINYDMQTGIVYRIPRSFDVARLEGSFTGFAAHETRHESLLLNFANAPGMDKFSRRRFDNYPSRDMSLSLETSYVHMLAKGTALTCRYSFSHRKRRDASRLSSLDTIPGDHTLLPSFFEGGALLPDFDNSYALSETVNTHTVSPELSAKFHPKGGELWIQLSFPILISDDRLKYHRGATDADKRRTSVLFEQKRNSLIRYKYLESSWFATATYTTKAPDLLAMIDFTDTTNPLVITKGNPDLKNSGTLRVSASYSLSKPRKRFYLSFGFDYESVANALAKGYSYDMETGIKTYKTVNVNGNRNITGNNYVSWEFGKRRMFSIVNILTADFNRSVDMLGVDANSYLNIVHRKTLKENLSLGLSKSGQKLTLTGNIDFSNYSGDNEAFSSFDALEFHYGLQGLFKFPRGFGLQTDFMVYSRRGFQDTALNTDNYVWNARATYSILKGNLIFTLDGYDILHNLTNVFYSVNAQGRTETIRTVLPRYFMLGVQWKFNSKK